MEKKSKVMKKMYPDWYFKYYDNIFKRNTYLEEISSVNLTYPLKDKVVLEIGSGKGYHAEEIIKLTPKTLILIDYQKEAFNILKNKFKYNSIIKPIMADAFNLSLRKKADIAIIFFSVLPQVSTKCELQNRIRHIFNNLLKPNGVLAFEYIDYEKSIRVYHENQKSLLINNDEIEVYIKSSYLNDTILIKYFGTLNEIQLNYEICLLRLNNSIIEVIAKELGLEQFDNISFDKEERRRMTFLRRPATNIVYK